MSMSSCSVRPSTLTAVSGTVAVFPVGLTGSTVTLPSGGSVTWFGLAPLSCSAGSVLATSGAAHFVRGALAGGSVGALAMHASAYFASRTSVTQFASAGPGRLGPVGTLVPLLVVDGSGDAPEDVAAGDPLVPETGIPDALGSQPTIPASASGTNGIIAAARHRRLWRLVAELGTGQSLLGVFVIGSTLASFAVMSTSAKRSEETNFGRPQPNG